MAPVTEDYFVLLPRLVTSLTQTRNRRPDSWPRVDQLCYFDINIPDVSSRAIITESPAQVPASFTALKAYESDYRK